jgi:hypothetical protein
MSESMDEFSRIFDEERSEWTEKIKVYALHLKDIKTVATAQVDLFGARQTLLEYSFKLAKIHSKLNTKYKVDKAKKLREISENADYKYGSTEKNMILDGSLAELTSKMELVDGHRKFIDQTVQTVDHMLYGIRQRIALEDYLRGSTIK